MKAPLPYHIEEHLEKHSADCTLVIADANGLHVAHIEEWQNEKETAEFLIKAANSHEALVRACQAAQAYLVDPPSRFESNRAEAAAIIAAALDAAKNS